MVWVYHTTSRSVLLGPAGLRLHLRLSVPVLLVGSPVVLLRLRVARQRQDQRRQHVVLLELDSVVEVAFDVVIEDDGF